LMPARYRHLALQATRHLPANSIVFSRSSQDDDRNDNARGRIEPLTQEAFRPYGDVIEPDRVAPRHINQGFAERVDDLAYIDVMSDNGRANVSVFNARPYPAPMAVKMMERHPLGSQLFYPLQEHPWLVLVCDEPSDLQTYRAFAANGRQGVNYARGTWHHPLIVLTDSARFIVVDRAGPGTNLEEAWLDAEHILHIDNRGLTGASP
jgi:ureidoglycolate lyase